MAVALCACGSSGAGAKEEGDAAADSGPVATDDAMGDEAVGAPTPDAAEASNAPDVFMFRCAVTVGQFEDCVLVQVPSQGCVVGQPQCSFPYC